MGMVKAFHCGTGESCSWYIGGRDESVFDGELFGGDRDSLLVCAAVLPDSWAKFRAVFRGSFWDTDFQFFCGGPNCGVGDFSGVVVEGFARTRDCGMVDCAAFEFGSGIVTGAALVFVKADGRGGKSRREDRRLKQHYEWCDSGNSARRVLYGREAGD